MVYRGTKLPYITSRYTPNTATGHPGKKKYSKGFIDKFLKKLYRVPGRVVNCKNFKQEFNIQETGKRNYDPDQYRVQYVRQKRKLHKYSGI